MNKKLRNIIISIFSIMLILVVAFPRREMLNDGGSVEYIARLYKITKYHELAENGYMVGTGIAILGKEIYNNKKLKVEENNENNNSENMAVNEIVEQIRENKK